MDRKSARIITLLTDFGLRDPYVGQMKGVILGIAPDVGVVDLTHDIAPQDVFDGAYVLKSSYRYFPRGTVHVAVVDPGVGTERKAIALRAEGHYFVVPDNGIVSLITADTPPAEVVELTNREYFLPDVSWTFHGRDIFAPVAAHIANGMALRDFGESLQRIEKLDLPRPRHDRECVRGEVIHIDRFGNLITNIRDSDLVMIRKSQCKIRIADKIIKGVKSSYGAVGKREILALFGGSGLLEVSVNLGNAAAALKAGKGTHVEVTSR
ncbi:MAG: SAM-dependent chlorinase/fluorinase [Planctomycetes bacterium]|nr:SAM-dependent chlorinase/fluorinase [Planctomycetota bacterium]